MSRAGGPPRSDNPSKRGHGPVGCHGGSSELSGGKPDDDIALASPQAGRMAEISRCIQRAVADPEMVGIVKRLRASGNRNWDWDEGGCHAFAPALKSVIGGEVVGVMQWEDNPSVGSGENAWINMHSMVLVGNSVFDCRGLSTPEEALARHGFNHDFWANCPKKVSTLAALNRAAKRDPSQDYFWPVDDYLNDEDQKTLRRMMKKHLGHIPKDKT